MAKTPTEIKSLARCHTDRAIQVLAGIMDCEDAPHAARVAAANSLIDRGWGKAEQHTTADVNHRYVADTPLQRPTADEWQQQNAPTIQ